MSPANTSSAPAICGTTFGLTKLPHSMRGRPGRGQPVAQLGAHRRLERDAVVLQPVPRTDVAERDVHQTAVARFAATDWKNSITTLADSSGSSIRFVWPLPSIT